MLSPILANLARALFSVGQSRLGSVCSPSLGSCTALLGGVLLVDSLHWFALNVGGDVPGDGSSTAVVSKLGRAPPSRRREMDTKGARSHLLIRLFCIKKTI